MSILLMIFVWRSIYCVFSHLIPRCAIHDNGFMASDKWSETLEMVVVVSGVSLISIMYKKLVFTFPPVMLVISTICRRRVGCVSERVWACEGAGTS